jgi:hypothetical protein
MAVAPSTSAWDTLVQSLGIAEEDLADSRELKAWAKKYCGTRYVPEHLLNVWHIVPRFVKEDAI